MVEDRRGRNGPERKRMGARSEPGAEAPLRPHAIPRRRFLEDGLRWSAAAVAVATSGWLPRPAGAKEALTAYYYNWSAWNAYYNWSAWNAYSNYYNWSAWNAYSNYYNWSNYFNWNNYYDWIAWNNTVQEGEWSMTPSTGGLMDTAQAYDHHLARFMAQNHLEEHSTQLRKAVVLVRSGGSEAEARDLLEQVRSHLSPTTTQRAALNAFARENGLDGERLVDAFSVYEKVAAAYLEMLTTP